MATKKRLKVLAHANENECKAAGLKPQRVEELAREFSRLGRAARRLGITVFGGSGTGSLRFNQDDSTRPLVVGYISGGSFDGGDGACYTDDEGLLRGE
jgi:hypothetical protein